MENTLFLLIIFFVVLGYVLNLVLEILNQSSKQTELPKRLEKIYDSAEYAKSQKYDKEKTKMSLISSSFSTVIILILLLTGGFAYLDAWITGYTTNMIWKGLIFFGVLGIAADFLSIPFSVHNTFVLEEKYGFNKTTVKTFILDKLKGYALGVIIGGGLMALLIWIYVQIPDYFWILGWGLVFGFSLFITLFYTSVLLPLFNKLTPLENGELRDKIELFSNKVGFPLKNIYVIDGSKRSTKANAFFSGMGSRKSIVLFDTLMDNHADEELVAILAHEVGHYKKKHVQKSMVISSLQTLFLFLILGWILQEPSVSGALGVAEPSFHIGILAFGLLYSPISMIIGILMNMFSRKNEFEADAYAAVNYGSKPLQNALKTLSKENLTNMEPHPAYVFINYSHPPVLERLKALEAHT